MKKEKFLISTIILIIGGALTKVLGMIIRIIMTRIVGDEGISLYMVVFPTFSLFMTLSQLGLPIAISKLVSEEKYNNKNVIFSIIPFSILINILLILIILVFAPTISIKLLKDYRCYYPILAIALVIPFDSLSNIVRGYFFGKQKMIPHVISHITEQIVRLILIILIIPKIIDKSLIYAISILIGINAISEFISMLILLIFIPKQFNLSKKDIKPNLINVKNILNIAIPTTGGRLIGSIGYFLEPILITLACKYSKYTSSYLIMQYGVIEGYVMPLLLLPSFFTNAISSALLPVISNAYSNNKIKYLKKKIKQATFISLSIGISLTSILVFKSKLFLKLLYNTSLGSNYILIVFPFFLIFYVQSILSVTLQAIDKSKYIMIDNTIAIIIRCIIIYFGTILWGIYGFLLSICINILVVTILHYIHVKRAFNAL